jgi:predicted Zn-ribbon and HTH transcriptional regulator
MKKEIVIPILKEEDVVAANKRRENYAYTRDMQAMEFNDAITKRLILEAKHPVKCEKCGKEFIVEASTEGPATCPECGKA